MKTTLKQLIKEAILEALLEFTHGGVATVDEEFKEDDKNSGGGETGTPGDTIPDSGGNDTIPRPTPLPPGPFTGGLGI